MAINLNTSYPGKVTVDAGNPNGTFKNRTSDALKDGTPFEKKWASDVWGFLAHILGLGGVSPNGAEENETVSQYYDTLEGLVGRRKVEFETSKDLKMDYTSNTTAQATFSRMSLLDSNYVPKFLNNETLTWTMPGNLEPGTSEKSSTTYGCWVDSDKNVVLAPDIVGSCDSTVSGFLVDSTATLLTDLIHAGDILYNLTTNVKTTASADAAANDRVAATDNIFSSGDEYKIVKMSPVGLGAWRERLGSVFNNSGSNFDDSYYTQIQPEKSYSTDASEISISIPNQTSLRAFATVKQVNDWTGKGTWYITAEGSAIVSVATLAAVFTFAGVIFSDGWILVPPIVGWQANSNAYTKKAYLGNGTNIFNIDLLSLASLEFMFGIDTRLSKKPTFHT